MPILFNIANTVIQLPFALLLVKLVTRLIPGEPEIIERGLKVDDRLLETPSIALSQVKKEIARMGDLALNLKRRSKYILLL